MSHFNCVIGAAGHIDHGKTSLVKALTGVDCDRLEEEKKRGITIDIGFAKLELSDGMIAGIVDVPGHQRFIHNMLAGAAGIDVALFVVSADDAVMPQTVEHLAILEMLGVTRGVVALTKADLVDEETLELATMEVSDLIQKSCLAGSRIIPCSSATGLGIEQLKDELNIISKTASTRWADGFFRMPIDRVFIIKGHGLVVTGTVFSGKVAPDDKSEISPGNMDVRARRVQRHGETAMAAEAGSRAAINITGVDKNQLRRGMVICHPAVGAAFTQFTAEVICHSTSPLKIVHGRSYLLHLHTAETLCRVYLSSDKSLNPGEKGIAQARFYDPIQMLNADRFVLRSSSARNTVGGGVILEPGGAPLGRRRLVSLSDKWDALKNTDSGIRAMIGQTPWGTPLDKLMGMFNLPKPALAKKLKQLKNEISTFEWKSMAYAFDIKASKKIIGEILEAVTQFHKNNPALQGIEESALAIAALPSVDYQLSAYWIRRAVSSKKIEFKGSALKLPGRDVEFSGDDERSRQAILGAYQKGGLKNAPKTDKVYKELGMKKSEAARMIRILTQTGDLVSLAPDYTIHHDTLNTARNILVKEIEENGPVETARYRDLLGVGRKSAIDILEHFDRAGFTKRKENRRSLVKK